MPGKEEFEETLRYFRNRLKKAGVDVRLKQTADADTLLGAYVWSLATTSTVTFQCLLCACRVYQRIPCLLRVCRVCQVHDVTCLGFRLTYAQHTVANICSREFRPSCPGHRCAAACPRHPGHRPPESRWVWARVSQKMLVAVACRLAAVRACFSSNT